MSGLPRYSAGDRASAAEVSDSKAQPPGYIEASGASGVSGEVYAEKASVLPPNHHETRRYTVHITETDNFVLLDEDSAAAVYYVDNTSSLSKMFIRSGNSTRCPIVSTSKAPGPFVKEIQIDFESKVKSGTKQAMLSAEGKFSVSWKFTLKQDTYEWKYRKGIWTLTQGSAQVAEYDVERALKIQQGHGGMADAIVATVFSIFLFNRLASERRHRALKSITGKSNSGMGTALLL